MNAHQNLPEEFVVAALSVEPEIVSVLIVGYLVDDPGTHCFCPTIVECDSLPIYKAASDISA